jgi:hypothetical protein
MRSLKILRSLDASQLYDQAEFYGRFQGDIQNCQEELLIESAFMTLKRTNALLPTLNQLISRGVKVVVNTRWPDEHEDFMREQAMWCTGELQSAGVVVLFTAGLHRKVAVLDRRIVWEGSLNILSQSDSCELMRRTDSTDIADNLLNLIGLKRFL